MQAAGHVAVYEPAMVVKHLVPASRLRVGYYLRWFYWSGVTHARLDASKPATGARILGAPRYLFRQLARSAAMVAGAALTGGWSAAVAHATEAAFALGYIRASWSSRLRSPAHVSGPRVEAA